MFSSLMDRDQGMPMKQVIWAGKMCVVRLEGQYLYREKKDCPGFSVDRVIGKEVRGG